MYVVLNPNPKLPYFAEILTKARSHGKPRCANHRRTPYSWGLRNVVTDHSQDF